MVTGCNARRIYGAIGGVVALTIAWSGAAFAGGEPTAPAQTSVIVTGAYLHFPKILVHTTSPDANPALGAGDFAQDTVIQLTNTSSEAVEVNCYYVNANRHCGGPPGSGPVCRTDAECAPGIRCLPGWQSADFSFTLTPRQPLGWTASSGLPELPCFNGPCPETQNGVIPPVTEEPFVGELRCIRVESDVPVADNDLKGEATIVEAGPFGANDEVLAAAYNAVSFQGIEDGQGGDAVCLGGAPGSADCAATYTPCMANLALQHFFDGAITPEGEVETVLTLSPCSTRLEAGDLIAPENRVVALMLVYNEFEQRFSTGAVVDCLENIRLVDIDTPLGPQGDASSLFSIGTQGTLGGLTRIKGQTSDDDFGPGLVALAHQYFSDDGGALVSSSAYHVNGNFAAEPEFDAVYPPVP